MSVPIISPTILLTRIVPVYNVLVFIFAVCFSKWIGYYFEEYAVPDKEPIVRNGVFGVFKDLLSFFEKRI